MYFESVIDYLKKTKDCSLLMPNDIANVLSGQFVELARKHPGPGAVFLQDSLHLFKVMRIEKLHAVDADSFERMANGMLWHAIRVGDEYHGVISPMLTCAMQIWIDLVFTWFEQDTDLACLRKTILHCDSDMRRLILSLSTGDHKLPYVLKKIVDFHGRFIGQGIGITKRLAIVKEEIAWLLLGYGFIFPIDENQSNWTHRIMSIINDADHLMISSLIQPVYHCYTAKNNFYMITLVRALLAQNFAHKISLDHLDTNKAKHVFSDLMSFIRVNQIILPTYVVDRIFSVSASFELWLVQSQNDLLASDIRKNLYEIYSAAVTTRYSKAQHSTQYIYALLRDAPLVGFPALDAILHAYLFDFPATRNEFIRWALINMPGGMVHALMRKALNEIPSDIFEVTLDLLRIPHLAPIRLNMIEDYLSLSEQTPGSEAFYQLKNHYLPQMQSFPNELIQWVTEFIAAGQLFADAYKNQSTMPVHVSRAFYLTNNPNQYRILIQAYKVSHTKKTSDEYTWVTDFCKLHWPENKYAEVIMLKLLNDLNKMLPMMTQEFILRQTESKIRELLVYADLGIRASMFYVMALAPYVLNKNYIASHECMDFWFALLQFADQYPQTCIIHKELHSTLSQLKPPLTATMSVTSDMADHIGDIPLSEINKRLNRYLTTGNQAAYKRLVSYGHSLLFLKVPNTRMTEITKVFHLYAKDFPAPRNQSN